MNYNLPGAHQRLAANIPSGEPWNICRESQISQFPRPTWFGTRKASELFFVCAPICIYDSGFHALNKIWFNENDRQAGGAAVLTKSKNLKLDGLPLLEGLRTGEQVMMMMMMNVVMMMKVMVMMMAPYFHSEGMCHHDVSLPAYTEIWSGQDKCAAGLVHFNWLSWWGISHGIS